MPESVERRVAAGAYALLLAAVVLIPTWTLHQPIMNPAADPATGFEQPTGMVSAPMSMGRQVFAGSVPVEEFPGGQLKPSPFGALAAVLCVGIAGGFGWMRAYTGSILWGLAALAGVAASSRAAADRVADPAVGLRTPPEWLPHGEVYLPGLSAVLAAGAAPIAFCAWRRWAIGRGYAPLVPLRAALLRREAPE
ncbi:hypothetical protein [Nocardiopsis coralliicola]